MLALRPPESSRVRVKICDGVGPPPRRTRRPGGGGAATLQSSAVNTPRRTRTPAILSHSFFGRVRQRDNALAVELLARGHRVICVDNLETGSLANIAHIRDSERFRFLHVDIIDPYFVDESVDFVYHLAANADVRFGPEHPRTDLEQNTIATHTVLEAMRRSGVRRIASSTFG